MVSAVKRLLVNIVFLSYHPAQPVQRLHDLQTGKGRTSVAEAE
jgi:hypothetical protein